MKIQGFDAAIQGPRPLRHRIFTGSRNLILESAENEGKSLST